MEPTSRDKLNVEIRVHKVYRDQKERDSRLDKWWPHSMDKSRTSEGKGTIGKRTP